MQLKVFMQDRMYYCYPEEQPHHWCLVLFGILQTICRHPSIHPSIHPSFYTSFLIHSWSFCWPKPHRAFINSNLTSFHSVCVVRENTSTHFTLSPPISHPHFFCMQTTESLLSQSPWKLKTKGEILTKQTGEMWRINKQQHVLPASHGMHGIIEKSLTMRKTQMRQTHRQSIRLFCCITDWEFICQWQ